MLKRFCAILCSLIVLVSLFARLSVNAYTPVFKDYSESYEVYLYDCSSLATITTASEQEYLLLNGVVGESVRLSAKNFELNELLDHFNAQIKFTEQVEDKNIFYAYSPKIRFKKTVRGETINLQIAIDNTSVTLGSPLIFGSF